MRTLLAGNLDGNIVAWDGMDDQGQRVEPGIYFGRLANGGRVAVEKFVLLHP